MGPLGHLCARGGGSLSASQRQCTSRAPSVGAATSLSVGVHAHLAGSVIAHSHHHHHQPHQPHHPTHDAVAQQQPPPPTAAPDSPSPPPLAALGTPGSSMLQAMLTLTAPPAPTAPAAAAAAAAQQGWWVTTQASLTPETLHTLPAHTLALMLANCRYLGAGRPSYAWVQAVLHALVSTVSHALSKPAGTSEQPYGDVPAELTTAGGVTSLDLPLPSADAGMAVGRTATDVEAALALLPAALSAVAAEGDPSPAVQRHLATGLALLKPRLQTLGHADLAHVARVAVALDAVGGLHLGGAAHRGGGPKEEGQHGLVLALHARAMQLSWADPRHLPSLACTVHGLSVLGLTVTTTWLASCLRGAEAVHAAANSGSVGVTGGGPGTTAGAGLPLADLVLLGKAIAAAAAPASAPLPPGMVVTDAGVVAMRHAAQVWLREWYGQAVSGQLLGASASQLADILTAIHTLPSTTQPPSPLPTSTSHTAPANFKRTGRMPSTGLTHPAAAGSAARSSSGGLMAWREPHDVAVELLERQLVDRATPAHELVQHLVGLCATTLPQPYLQRLLRAGILRLTAEAGSLPSGAALPVCIMLSAATAADPGLAALAPPLLQRLLPLTVDALPSYETAQLLRLLSALATLDHQPPPDWQAMWFTTMRNRLPLLQAEDLLCMLGAVVALHMVPDDQWMNEVFPTSRKLLAAMDIEQITDLLWMLGQQAPCMDWLWAPAYEYSSIPRLAELSPTMLAGTIKALTGLSYRPSKAWMEAFLAAVQAQLFAPGAVQMCAFPSSPDDAPEPSVVQYMGARSRWRAKSVAAGSVAGRAAGGAPSPGAPPDLDHGHVTVDALMIIVDSLTYTKHQPNPKWMNDFLDAIRCKLSLLDGSQLSTLLLYVVSAAHQPDTDWWCDYLAVVQPTLRRMGINDLATHLALLNTLGVVPEPAWLDAWCTSTADRLCLFLPGQLHQVLACLAACGHTPPRGWLRYCGEAVEHAGRLIAPPELLRAAVILDRMGATLSPGLLALVYDRNVGQAGLADCDPAVLAQLMWCLQAVQQMPDDDWLIEYITAAQAALPHFTRPQLECVISGLHAICSARGPGGAGAVGGGVGAASGGPTALEADLDAAMAAAVAGPGTAWPDGDQRSGRGGGDGDPASRASPVAAGRPRRASLSASIMSFTIVAREWIV